MMEGSWMVMNQGPQPGQTFVLDRDRLTVGRDPSNDVVINDAQISRQHARITRQGEKLVIEDLGSTNGTFANGMRLAGPHVLTNGDVIGLGDSVTLTYYEVGAAEETLVGRPAAQPPRPPAAPPPARRPTPPSPPAYAPAPPPPRPATPPAEGKGGTNWLVIGCGMLVLLTIVACAALFVLDSLGWLPAFFYEPLRWLGLA